MHTHTPISFQLRRKNIESAGLNRSNSELSSPLFCLGQVWFNYLLHFSDGWVSNFPLTISSEGDLTTPLGDLLHCLKCPNSYEVFHNSQSKYSVLHTELINPLFFFNFFFPSLTNEDNWFLSFFRDIPLCVYGHSSWLPLVFSSPDRTCLVLWNFSGKKPEAERWICYKRHKYGLFFFFFLR